MENDNPSPTLAIPKNYFLKEDVVALSQKFLGHYLFSCIDGKLTGGQIIETEAYRAPDDRASHAYQNRRTKRNEAMFAEGGVAYIYRCYGIHSLLNIVTNKKEIPHAILIRALKPTHGIDLMKKRRKSSPLTAGPGMVSQALGVDTTYNGTSLAGPTLWIQKGPQTGKITAGPRIGIDYAGEDAKLPWRFILEEC